MNRIQRSAFRLAQAIHRANAEKPPPRPLPIPRVAWERAERLVRLRDQVQRRGWLAAEKELNGRLRGAIDELQSELLACRRSLELQSAERRFASPQELYADLLALSGEFADIDWNPARKTLTALTPPITLEDLPLGPFAIELRWESLHAVRRGCYCVVAQSPNPAGTLDRVTHPHVQDESLCEGDAQPAIRQALSEGRLLDFFLLVRSVLETYNERSPYVAIEDWEGMRCEDCDASVPVSEASGCMNCGRNLCDGCWSTCSSCDDTFCGDCRSRCPVCQETNCTNCLETCAECGRQVCPNCLHSDRKCESCHETQEPESADAGAAVQPHGLGQVALPA